MRFSAKAIRLPSIASWADDYRQTHPETARWHFVNIPLDATTYEPETQCKPTNEGDCIIAALSRLRYQMLCARSPTDRVNALMFTVHLLGDLHQPLHTIAEEAGGNGIHVQVRFSEPTCSAGCDPNFVNLHSVWDSTLIERTYFAWGAYGRSSRDGLASFAGSKGRSRGNAN